MWIYSMRIEGKIKLVVFTPWTTTRQTCITYRLTCNIYVRGGRVLIGLAHGKGTIIGRDGWLGLGC